MARTGTAFGGLASEMLAKTTSIMAVFTGAIFLVVIGGLGALAVRTGSDLIAVVGAQFLISFFLAHFAMEGYSDEWERAGRPIPPTQVAVVAMRYMALAIILLAPLFVVARSRATSLALLTAPQASTVFVLIYLLILAASPPALLVVAVSASSWGEIVSPGHWASRFRTRWIDLFLIYVIFVGSIFCLVLTGLPIVMFAWQKGTQSMLLAGGAVSVFAIGFAISLLGRLCGSYAVVLPPEVVEAKPPTLHSSLSQFAGTSAVRSGPTGAAGAAASANIPSAGASVPPRKTVLLDAGPKVDQLRAKHGADAAALISALRELDEAFQPHPAVRQTLTLTLVAAGRLQEAVDVARGAIPLCIASGNLSGAALVYEALLPSGHTFGLTKDQTVALGDALKSIRRFTGAVEVYSGVLRSHAGDVKAMKGMIAIAQSLSHQKETAADAVRIYDYLASHCPGSPLLDFVNTERAKVEKKSE